MTPAQRAAARDLLAMADRDLASDRHPGESASVRANRFRTHTLHLAIALGIALGEDPFAGLTGPEAAGADPTRSTPPQGPTP